jgi:hypothetical protein
LQLFHAIIAVSTFSSSHCNGYCTLEALQHYQQALPSLQSSLRSATDISSDGTLFTHFLLLIYEILAAEQWHECMWQQHLTQLLRILITRVELYGRERLPFLVWCLAVLDTYAVLTAGGNGELVVTLAENGIMPDPQQIVAPLIPTEATETVGLFEEVLSLAQKIVILAGKLGQLSYKLRDPMAPVDVGNSGETECHRIVFQLKNAWQMQRPRVESMIGVTAAATSTSGSTILPRIQETYEHVRPLFPRVHDVEADAGERPALSTTQPLSLQTPLCTLSSVPLLHQRR